MNNDIKWEAVDLGDLEPADKVRLTHENGNIIHGEVYKDGKYIEAGAVGHWAARFQEEGYRFERAVPERLVPVTEVEAVEKKLATLRACIEIVGLSGDFDGHPHLRARVLDLLEEARA